MYFFELCNILLHLFGLYYWNYFVLYHYEDTAVEHLNKYLAKAGDCNFPYVPVN